MINDVHVLHIFIYLFSMKQPEANDQKVPLCT